MTSSNGSFPALQAICAGNSPVDGEFPAQRPVTWSFDIFFDLRLNKRLSKESWGWWFEMPSRPLSRHSNDDVWWTRVVASNAKFGRGSLLSYDDLHQIIGIICCLKLDTRWFRYTVCTIIYTHLSHNTTPWIRPRVVLGIAMPCVSTNSHINSLEKTRGP